MAWNRRPKKPAGFPHDLDWAPPSNATVLVRTVEQIEDDARRAACDAIAERMKGEADATSSEWPWPDEPRVTRWWVEQIRAFGQTGKWEGG